MVKAGDGWSSSSAGRGRDPAPGGGSEHLQVWFRNEGMMDAASGVVKEGSVTRVMNVYDHFLALLGVAVLHECSTPLSVLSRALLSTHPHNQPIR